MKRPRSRLLFNVITSVTLTTASYAQAADLVRHEHKELPAVRGGTLTFQAFAGAIDVKTHEKDAVIYDSLLKPRGRGKDRASELADLVEFDYQTSNGDVKITMKWKDDSPPRNVNLDVHHTLFVPAKYHLDLRTAGGSITAMDIVGSVAAKTSGGNIRLGKVNGQVKALTSGGRITLGNVKGDADLGTSGGNIKTGTVEGSVSARTSGGSIEVGAVTGPMKGRTSGGSIRVNLVHQIDQPLELSTSGGNIRLTVPGGFKADLDASTSGGRVHCELPIEGLVKPHSIDAKINGGGPQVRLKTSGGNITVEKR